MFQAAKDFFGRIVEKKTRERQRGKSLFLKLARLWPIL